MDEKRRLIYELLVEAKGLAQQTAAAQRDLQSLGATAASVGKMIKGGLATLGVGLTLHGIAEVISETQELIASLRVLGVTGEDAEKSITAIQDIAFTTGQTVHDVAEVFKEATEAVQLWNGGQEDAAALTDAMTRSMVAQGK